jgi:undecaprenyl-diphosphatase
VVAALWAGVEVREAAAFSFLMAIPAITGAAVLQLPEVSAGQLGPGRAALLAGGLMAGVTGIAAIRIFVSMLRGGSFHRFGVYCWLAGGAFLLYLGLR